MSIEDETALEIYRQRYETFRYLDSLHWFMLQVAVGGGSVAAAFMSFADQTTTWWQYVLLGILFVAIGISMLRIKSGARANNVILKEFADRIGDTGIPVNKSIFRSISFWVATLIILAGVSAATFGISRCGWTLS